MLDNFDLLDSVGPDLDEARAKIEITRDALQALLDTQDALVGDLAPISQLVAHLDRMARDVRRAEEAASSEAGAVGRVR